VRLLLVVLASLGAAGFFSLATALKHRSAGTMPSMERLSPSAVGAFALATLRHPLWLAGIGADVGGLGLQITALHLGALSLVQPLLVSAVLFSLVVAHRIAGTRMARREVGYAGLLVLAVAGFLAVSGALGVHEGRPYVGSTIIASIVVVALVVVCVGMARRLRTAAGGRWSAALLGLAAVHEKLNHDPLSVTLSLLTLVVMLFTVAQLSLVRAHLEEETSATGSSSSPHASRSSEAS